jgi:glycosyltransferase involved in cell wall biosynthesis
MRVLFSITNLLVGGAQTFLVSLANEMSKTNKVYIYCFYEPQISQKITGRISPQVKLLIFPPILKKFSPKLKKIFSILKIKGNPAFLLKKFHLRFLVKWLRIDIIHSQLFHSDEFITHIFKDRKIPIIITEHGCYNYVIQEGFVQKDSIRRIFERVDGAAYISEKNKQYIIDLTGNNQIMFRKMNNGIPKVNLDPNVSLKLKESLNIKPNDFVFGMVARGIKEKGWEIAVAAFKELQKKTGKKIHLIFIGDSSYLRELKIEVERKSIHNIYFLGSISEPMKWINCFDVGLLPSYFLGESLPMTVIEYLACEKPVIATDMGSIKDMIKYGDMYGGIIFQYRPDFQQNVANLKEAMKTYLEDHSILIKHKEIVNTCFNKFNIENTALEYLEFYQILINIRKQTHR